MNKAPIKAKKRDCKLACKSLFFALEVGILRMPANERRSREIGAYTIDLLSQDNVVSKRKKPQKPCVSGVFLYSKKRIVRKFIRLETVKHLSAR